ncbi:MAG: arylesterase [Candidatus Binatia bacterium]
MRYYRDLFILFCVLSIGNLATKVNAEVVQHSTGNMRPGKVIVFFGDSLTAGYGLDRAQAFPALIQEKITANGWDFSVVNAGVSGETTAGGLRRVDWVLRRPVDIFVLELGANDGLRGLSLEQARANLQAIIDRVRTKYPSVYIVLAGMQLPANLGRDYTSRFRTLFPELAKENRAALIPFLLEGVGGIRSLNLPDGIHPNVAGHRIVAENVWRVLKPVLQAMQSPQVGAQ